MLKYCLAAMGALMVCGCGEPAPDASSIQNAEAPADIGVNMAGPQAGPAAAADAQPLAPSFVAKTPCPDDGPRLPLSGVCSSRAISYMEPDSAEAEAPAGCEWTVNETPFADQVLLYRALACGPKTVALEYAGGAHAAELSYTSSALHPEAAPDPNDAMAHPAVGCNPRVPGRAARTRNDDCGNADHHPTHAHRAMLICARHDPRPHHRRAGAQ